MAAANRLGPARFQALARVLVDGLEHPEAAAPPAADQAPVDERREDVQIGVADGLGGLEVEAPGEDGQAREQLPLLAREQLVAPLDRGPQRALALGRAAPAAAE